MQLHLHLLMSFYCVQYAQFVRLMERLLQCGAAEKEFVQSFRRSVTVQSKKQPIEPVQHDAQGMAFSTSEGNGIPRREVSSTMTVKLQGLLLAVALWDSFDWFFCLFLPLLRWNSTIFKISLKF